MTSPPALQNHYIRAALGASVAYVGARLLTSRISKLASTRIGLPPFAALTTGAVLMARPSRQRPDNSGRTTTDEIRVVERDGVHIREDCVEIGPKQHALLCNGECPWFATYFATTFSKRLDHSPETVRDVICLQVEDQDADVLPPLPSLKQAAGLQQNASDSERESIATTLNREVERLQTLVGFASEVTSMRALTTLQERLMEVRPYDDEESIGEWLAFADRHKFVLITRDCIELLVHNPEWQIPSLPSVYLHYFNPVGRFLNIRGYDPNRLDKIKRLEAVAQAINLEIDILDLFEMEGSDMHRYRVRLNLDQAEMLVRLGATHAYIIRGAQLEEIAPHLTALLEQAPLRDEQRLCLILAPLPPPPPRGSRGGCFAVPLPAIIQGRRARAREVLTRRPDLHLSADHLHEVTGVTEAQRVKW